MAIATTSSRFQTGVGTILYSDFKCIGNESDILACPLTVNQRGNDCNHFQEAGVECLGRQTCMFISMCAWKWQ